MLFHFLEHLGNYLNVFTQGREEEKERHKYNDENENEGRKEERNIVFVLSTLRVVIYPMMWQNYKLYTYEMFIAYRYL